MKKLVYIAAPFFTPAQLVTVEQVEKAVERAGLAMYSPRHDGVLMAMTPEQRKANAKGIFESNVNNIIHANGFLACLDEHDTGTYWECGFAYYHRRYNLGRHTFRMFAYTSGSKPINVMLEKSFNNCAIGLDQLHVMLTAFAEGVDLLASAQTEKVY